MCVCVFSIVCAYLHAYHVDFLCVSCCSLTLLFFSLSLSAFPLRLCVCVCVHACVWIYLSMSYPIYLSILPSIPSSFSSLYFPSLHHSHFSFISVFSVLFVVLLFVMVARNTGLLLLSTVPILRYCQASVLPNSIPLSLSVCLLASPSVCLLASLSLSLLIISRHV